LGSKQPCGGAAPHLQRYRTWSPPSDDASQPKLDIHARRSEGAAASAKSFPKADLQVCSGDPSNSAPWTDVSEASFVTFVKAEPLGIFYSPNSTKDKPVWEG
tara:strand:+ start:176 stop:481 length:306 start_codon:yes stop_codon:yes gene_type:complete